MRSTDLICANPCYALTPEIFKIMKNYIGKNGFSLNIVLKSQAKGGHYAASTSFRIDEFIQLGPMDSFKAKISVFDDVKGQWITKKSESSFFPVDWSPDRIHKEILSAYHNRAYTERRYWIGNSSSSLQIEGYRKNGIITSAYPYIK